MKVLSIYFIPMIAPGVECYQVSSQNTQVAAARWSCARVPGQATEGGYSTHKLCKQVCSWSFALNVSILVSRT